MWDDMLVLMKHNCVCTDHSSLRLQKRIQALLPWMLSRDTSRTELSLKSYHCPLFLPQAVQWPPPSPPQWLLTAQRSQRGRWLQGMVCGPECLGEIKILFWMASWAQEEMGAWSMRKGAMSSCSGKWTRVSFFSLRQEPLFLNRLRCRMSILGALQIWMTFLASLCSLQLEQYHSLPRSSSSSSLRLQKQSLSSTAVELLSSQQLPPFFLLMSSQSFRLFASKQPIPASENLISNSHYLRSARSSSCSSVSSSLTSSSAEQLYQRREQCRSTLRQCLRTSLNGRFCNIRAQQVAQSPFFVQAVGKMNLSTRLQMSSPVVDSRQKKSGNLNHMFSQSAAWQYPFLHSLEVSSTRLVILRSYSVSSKTKTFLFSFSILQTMSESESRPARQMPSQMVTKYIMSESSSMLVTLEILLRQSGRLGLPQLKLIFLVFSQKLRLKTKHSKLLVTRQEIGRVTVMNGSKVIDSFWQVGQVTFDLYCPVMRSVMMD